MVIYYHTFIERILSDAEFCYDVIPKVDFFQGHYICISAGKATYKVIC